MSAPSSIDALFVYGTLRRGDVRWSFLAPFVVDDGVDDTVAGTLFDTGLGYPAAMFTGPDAVVESTVVGSTFRLAIDRLDEALSVLDAEEDTVHGLYRRVEVTTGRGVRAWAYEYGAGVSLMPIPSGDWFVR